VKVGDVLSGAIACGGLYMREGLASRFAWAIGLDCAIARLDLVGTLGWIWLGRRDVQGGGTCRVAVREHANA
jgi:hypothetical protein